MNQYFVASDTSEPRLHRWGLRSKVFAMLVPAMLPMLLIVGYGYVHAWRSMHNQVAQISRLAVRSGTTELNHRLESAKEKFEQWIGQDNKDRYGLHLQLESTGVAGVEFKRMLPGAPEFYMLALTDLDGTVQVAYARGKDPRRYLKGEGAPEISAFSGGSAEYEGDLVQGGLLKAAEAPFDTSYVFVYQTHDTEFEPNGYLLAYLDWRLVRDYINEVAARLHESNLRSARVMLVDHKSDKVLHARPADGKLDHTQKQAPLPSWEDLKALKEWLGRSENAGDMRLDDIGDRRECAAFWPVYDSDTLIASGVNTVATREDGNRDDTVRAKRRTFGAEMGSPLAVLALISERDFAGEARRFVRYGLLMAIIGIGLTGGGIWLTGGRLAKRIRTTVDKLHEVTRGQADLTKRMKVDTHDEIGALEASMNSFLERLQQIMNNLRESQDRYKALYENSLKIVYEHDRDGCFQAMNEYGLQLLGYTEKQINTKRIQDLLQPEGQEELRLAIEHVLEYGVDDGIHEFALRDAQGKRLWLQATAVRIDKGEQEPIVLGVGNDITPQKKAAEEKERLEEQLQQRQRLEGIGRLAGGVAHDFNNIMAGILGHAELLRESQCTRQDISESVTVIETGANRAAQLTRQLLGFARKGKLRELDVDLNQIVAEVVSLLQQTVDKRIRMTRKQQVEPAIVRGDPAQIQQVIMNLAINACDAMPDGGELTFKTEQISQKEAKDWMPNGGAISDTETFVFLTVTDTGTGIPPEVQDRVFEPFFTTKSAAKGSGMGLATAYGIVANHGGTIHLESEVNKGSVFCVLLPGLNELPKRVQPKTTPKPEVKNGNGRHVLVVDDEETLRRVIERRLSRMGYVVTTVADGLEAVDVYREHGHAIDLVVLDMTMPRMNGDQCFRELKKLNPGVQVILTTGHAVEGAAQELLNIGLSGFIQKPFDTTELVHLIEKNLKPLEPVCT